MGTLFSNTKNPKRNLIIFLAVLILIAVSIPVSKRKAKINETKRLPFTNTKLENVNDGIYSSETQTTFMFLNLEVTVSDKKIQNIKINDLKGFPDDKAESIIKEMIEKNKTSIELKKGQELETIVFISCVDSALKKGLQEDFSNDEN